MSQTARPRRRYRSPVRAEQARVTQTRILEAARALFLERGFADTTVSAVAERAGVAPETVYAVYRSKPGVLGGVVRAAVRREDEPEDPLERSWVRELLRVPDLPARIEGFARHTAATLQLTSPIYAIIRSAGTGASELDELDRELRRLRFADQAKIVAALAKGHELRVGLTVREAAETFSALTSPELHRILTDDRGWSRRRYARWLEEMVRSALLVES